MKGLHYFFIILLFVVCPLWPQRITLFDTPTALSMERGQFTIDSFFIQDGGVVVKAGAGVNKHVNLGIIEYVYDLIGNDRVRFQIPHVYGHFRVTALGDESYNFALGYNSLYNGSFSPFSKPSYGFYAVMTIGFPQQKTFLQSPHFFSFGLRLPVYHEFAEPDLFASLHLRFTPFLEFASEIENIHFSKQYEYYFINNNMIIINLFDTVSIDIAIQIGGRINKDVPQGLTTLVGRSLRIRFQSFF